MADEEKFELDPELVRAAEKRKAAAKAGRAGTPYEDAPEEAQPKARKQTTR